MKKYKYQTHTHTHPCSHCSHMMPDELTQALHDGGYQGVILTNHFYWGNTGIDTDLPWEEFVKAYELDYFECKKSAEKFDLDVIFGVEEHIDGGLEVLCYGVTPEILYAHPELRRHTLEDWDKIRKTYGVVIIQAHPFRNRQSIPVQKVLPHEFIDGIEIYNDGNNPEDNEKAAKYASENPGLILISGADTHSGKNACTGGIATDRRIKDEKDLAEILKSGTFDVL